jgi:pimeloyl-ACP methyl ester carboxylesterase
MDKNVNGFKIYYEELGKNNTKHVLFIHGLGSSALTWGDIPEALSHTFHTITVDLIGFGRSDKPKANYTIPYFSKFIKDFLWQIGIKDNDKITIVGHSLGGYIALDYAIENKEQTDKLVLIDSSGMLKKPTELLERYKEAVLEKNFFVRLKLLNRVFEDMLADTSRYTPSKTIAFMRVIEQQGAEDAFESAYEYSTTTPLELQRLKLIKNIPCLIIWGQNDDLIPPSHADIFENIFENKIKTIIPNAGHSPHVEKPAKTYRMINEFLTKP